MILNKKIQTTELDFDQLKESLKEFLRGQEEFQDYDFEGSGLSILLDILAYNTHYNALYTNLAINEAFLDSASKRSSVASKAKELGYTPRSARAATAVVDLTFINDLVNAPALVEIPKYTPFRALVDNTRYTFYTTQAHSAVKQDNQYVMTGIELREGTFLEYRYVVGPGVRFIIPNNDVDLSTLVVSVAENAQTSTSSTFVNVNNIVDVGATDKVFFIKELDNGLYEVEFGNNVIGAAVNPGNVITLTYIVCNRELPNGASTFTYGGGLPDAFQPFVTTIERAANGASAEEIDSIRWVAPRYYAAQNRCVTANDYKAIISAYFANIRSIAVWGGEEAVPPIYGKVFISIVPQNDDVLTPDEKNIILNDIIAPRKALSVTPEIVDPVYIRIELNTTFYYNPQLTTRFPNDIQGLVRQTIEDFNLRELNALGSVFKLSRLSTLIDQTEPSITSNITTVKIYRDVTPIFNVSSLYKINLGNPIYNSGVPEQSILSHGIYVSDTTNVCYIEDAPSGDSNIGALRLFYIDANNQKIYVRNVGTVDYSTGLIEITALMITGLTRDTFTLVIKPQSNDVVSTQYQFATIDPELTTIDYVVDSADRPYTFTSSRN
jgi:hypothetical protein